MDLDVLKARVDNLEVQQAEDRLIRKEIFDKINDLTNEVTKLVTTLKEQPRIQQPCQFEVKLEDRFDKHIEEHTASDKDKLRIFRINAIGIVAKVLQWGIIAFLGYIVAIRL